MSDYVPLSTIELVCSALPLSVLDIARSSLPGTSARKEEHHETHIWECRGARWPRRRSACKLSWPFVTTSLINQQYAASVIYIKITHALDFDRWVAKRRVVLADLLNAVTPLNGKPGRYRPDDKLLAFLQSL